MVVKASAGGGGKGMRQVHEPAELPRALAAARREAKNAFGDDNIYIEKLITRARHVEIQVLADSFGNCIHLGERECSIQRRHQKLIEEAPSVAVTPELRERMGAIAVRAAQAVGYSNAGTVEFLLDRAGSFYFLEMNTRLQVEHPVTELVTGIDIVKEQFALAGGRKLRWTQKDIRFNGHAIECRISAENPYNNFLPEAGRITSLIEPTGPGVRLETGIYAGWEVSLFYDPLLAKLVVWGETRPEAILRMRRALDEYRVGGIHTTIPFHQQVMDSPRFQWGQFDTAFVDGPDGFKLAAAPSRDLAQVAAIAATLVQHEKEQQAVLFGSPCDENGVKLSPWKVSGRPRRALLGGAEMKYFATVNDQIYEIDIDHHGRVTVDGVELGADMRLVGGTNLYSLLVDNASYEVVLDPESERPFQLSRDDAWACSMSCVSRTSGRGAWRWSTAACARQTASCSSRRPIPGLVVKAPVQPGQEVAEGDTLIILEAMKMENELRAPRAGVVHDVKVSPGAQVQLGQTLLT